MELEEVPVEDVPVEDPMTEDTPSQPPPENTKKGQSGRLRIKKVLIKNFKSYSHQKEFDDFHPGVNIVVGTNGSGKSNLIDAIRFVISSEYVKLRSEERRRMIHVNQNKSIVSGYVELVFDNIDRRLPIDSNEVTIRRNIGMSKADYYINGKHHKGEELMSILETAGFSRSNPYYIVQQGKLNALAQMNPHDKLQLLMEIAGTSVYDERKSETKVLLEENKGKMEKIRDVLTFLDKRIEELEEERNELLEYQKLDKESRALQYAVYSKELEMATSQIQNMDEGHKDNVNLVNKIQEEYEKNESGIDKTNKELTDKRDELNRITKDLEILEGERKFFYIKIFCSTRVKFSRE